MNDVGGAASPRARKEALLFNLGATVGANTEATDIVSLRLCPGTPSKVFLVFLELAILFVVGVGAASFPSLNAAARVIRGAITGAAVDATAMLSARLCPGTFANVFASRSLESGARGVEVVLSITTPARRAAARVVRGWISGLICVEGIALARKWGLPFVLSRPLLPPPTVEGLVALEGAYPSSDVVLRKAERYEEDTSDRMEPYLSSGSSDVGNGGEDAKREAIWISAVCGSGEPINPFCSRDKP